MVRPNIADRYSHSLQLFVAGDPDASAHLILPRIETAIRQVAVARGLPALQVAYGSLGRISYLAALLDQIEAGAIEEARQTWQYLRLLLVDGRGAALRNVLSHGLRSDSGTAEPVSRQEAALLLHAAMILSALDANGDLPIQFNYQP